MLDFYKYHLKKKKFYFSLSLYLVFFNYRVLLFFNKDNSYLYNSNFSYFVKSEKLNLLKINNTYVFTLFKTLKYNFVFDLFKKDLFLFYFDDLFLLKKFFNFNILVNFISIDYFFVNVIFLKKISSYFFLLNSNYIILNIFIYKFYYLLNCYIKKIVI
jgi:hypothetical protein